MHCDGRELRKKAARNGLRGCIHSTGAGRARPAYPAGKPGLQEGEEERRKDGGGWIAGRRHGGAGVRSGWRIGSAEVNIFVVVELAGQVAEVTVCVVANALGGYGYR